jgi:recombination protein RecA
MAKEPKAKEVKETKVNKDLFAIIANIEKSNGVKNIFKKGDEYSNEATISFGYPEVDEASNCGGVPEGRIVEIFGPESGGKSFLTLKLIASSQKSGKVCCLVDAEQSYDPNWAAKHGVKTDELFVIRDAITAEKLLDIVNDICKSKAFGVVVIDSVAALIPQKESEGSIGDQDYALLARAMSKGVRKINTSCGTTGTTCVFINQIREKMGVTYGSNETTPGGRALRFYAHQRIMVRPKGVTTFIEGKKEKVVSRTSSVKFIKNKKAPPMGECEIEIVFYAELLSPVVKLCSLAKDYKLVKMRDGQFQISKDIIDAKKNLDTGATSLVELSDYIVKNDLVQKLIEAYKEAIDEEGSTKVDKMVQDMIDNPALIVSPLEGKNVVTKEVKNDDKLLDEISADEGEAADESVEEEDK